MNVNVLTAEELKHFQKELIEEIKVVFALHEKSPELIKSRDLCKMLGISAGNLQNMRKTGKIEFIQIGRKITYELKHILDLIEKNKRNKGMHCILYFFLSSFVDIGFFGI